MVLRGSKTKPDQTDLLNIQFHIRQLRNLLNNIEEQQSDIEHEMASIVKDKPIQTDQQQVTGETIDEYKQHTAQIEIPSSLADSIKVLIDRLEFLETKHEKIEKELNEEQKQMQIVIKQFVCGGIAGMTARTTVAPIDRVKLIIQTSMSRQNLESGERGILGTARHEIAKGGIISMWKGVYIVYILKMHELYTDQ